jgi:hypothetical protein
LTPSLCAMGYTALLSTGIELPGWSCNDGRMGCKTQMYWKA